MKISWQKIGLVAGGVILLFTFLSEPVFALSLPGSEFLTTEVSSIDKAVEKASVDKDYTTLIGSVKPITHKGKQYYVYTVSVAGVDLLADPGVRAQILRVKGEDGKTHSVVVSANGSLKLGSGVVDSVIKEATGTVVETLMDSPLNPLDVFKTIFSGLINLLHRAVAFLGMVFMIIFDILINTDLGKLFSQSTIGNAWSAIRDLCNMVFILILLAIAFMTVFLGTESSSYSIKRALPMLIIAVLTINFSFLICRVVVEGADIVTRQFAGQKFQSGIIGDLMGYKSFSEILGTTEQPASGSSGAGAATGTPSTNTPSTPASNK